MLKDDQSTLVTDYAQSHPRPLLRMRLHRVTLGLEVSRENAEKLSNECEGLIGDLADLIVGRIGRRHSRQKIKRYSVQDITSEREIIRVWAPKDHTFDKDDLIKRPFPDWEDLVACHFSGMNLGLILITPTKTSKSYAYHHRIVMDVCGLLDEYGIIWYLKGMEIALDTTDREANEEFALTVLPRNLRLSPKLDTSEAIFHCVGKGIENKIPWASWKAKGEYIKAGKKNLCIQFCNYDRHFLGDPTYRYEIRLSRRWLKPRGITDPRQLDSLDKRREIFRSFFKGFCRLDYFKLLADFPVLEPSLLELANRSVSWQFAIITARSGMSRRKAEGKYFVKHECPVEIDFDSEWNELRSAPSIKNTR